MIRLSILFTFLFIFSSCVDQEEDFRTHFNTIKSTNDVEKIIEFLDEESLNYLSEMGKIAVKKDEDEIASFCNSTGYPLMTRYMVQALEYFAPTDTTTTIDLSNVVGIARLAEFGFLGTETRKRFSFKKLEELYPTSAMIIFRQKASEGVNLTSRGVFYLEEEEWKLNLQSTFNVAEKFLKKSYEQNGGTERAFINNVLENGVSEIRFRY